MSSSSRPIATLVRLVNAALKSFDKEFVDVDDATLVRLVNAAISLEIESLIALTCQAVADRLKGSSADQIRKRFNIDNDFTPEEEEKIRRENHGHFISSPEKEAEVRRETA